MLSILIGISLKYPLYTVIPDDNSQRTEEKIYIWNVVKNIRYIAANSQHRKAWITIRFVIIIFLQATPRVMYNVYYLMLTPVGNYLTPKQKDNLAWVPVIGVLACYYLNALVVMWSNKSLHKWLLGKYVNIAASTSSSSTNNLQKGLEEKDKSSLTSIELSKPDEAV